MATSESLKSCLSALNITVTNENVVEKCVKLCEDYNIDAEEFADEWVSFIISHENGRLLPPNTDLLEKMERRVLKKISKPIKAQQMEIIEEIPTKTESIVGSSQKFKDRTDSKSILFKYGNAQSSFSSAPMEYSLKFIDKIENFKYMYEKMGVKAKCIDNLTDWVSFKIMGQETDSIKYGQTGKMCVAGRIFPECLDEKLNHYNVVFEGTMQNYSKSVLLHLDKLKSYSLFPGQVVVIEGTNESKKFIVDQIHARIPAKLPETLPDFQDNFQIVVSCGPFTLPENLLNEPLKELLEYVKEKRPNLLILIGPFLDKNHKGFETIETTFEQFFIDLIDFLMGQLENLNIQVVIIPSDGDIHHHQIFPTPSFKLKRHYENLHLASNPSQIDINGFLIGASSPDILLHIANQILYRDLTTSTSTDRIKRSISHILDQRSFYPLFPPNEHISIDYQLLEKCGMMETVPNLLILPSNMTCYIHELGGCIVINPGKISKGTFARIEVVSGKGPVTNRTNAQILKI